MLSFENALNIFQQFPDLAREAHVSFSQSGEDSVLGRLLAKESEKGIFVDFGAYHPFRFSNTFLIYLQGWRGVNVDANPDSIELFKAIRIEDVNIHALLGSKTEELEYFRFAEGAYNTTDFEAAKALASRGNPETKMISSAKMRSVTPNEIFAQYVGNRKFDFLNIDVEGLDTQLLYSIDFEKYRPKVICIEVEITKWTTEPLRTFLDAKGYKPVSHTIHSAFFTTK